MNEVLSRAAQVLHDVFGYPAFRGPQAEIVEHVAAGGDALVLMPTGGGKSLCYQMPALLRDGHGRRRLAADRADAGPGRRAAPKLGVRAAFLNSSLRCRSAQRVEQRGRAPASSTCSTSRPSAC